jgi:RDD family
MGRMFIFMAILAIAYLIVRDIVDLYRARKQGVGDDPVGNSQFRYFTPESETPGMDVVKLAVAYVVDLVPFALVLLIIHTAIMPLNRISTASIEAGPGGLNAFVDATLVLISIVVGFMCVRALHVLLVAKTQRSLGWFLTGYRVADGDDEKPGIWNYITRSIDSDPLNEWGTSYGTRRRSTRIRYIAKESRLIRA